MPKRLWANEIWAVPCGRASVPAGGLTRRREAAKRGLGAVASCWQFTAKARSSQQGASAPRPRFAPFRVSCGVRKPLEGRPLPDLVSLRRGSTPRTSRSPALAQSRQENGGSRQPTRSVVGGLAEAAALTLRDNEVTTPSMSVRWTAPEQPLTDGRTRRTTCRRRACARRRV